MASFAVKSIDHVVLTVKSIEATVDFYTTRLGMKHEVFTSKGVERYVTVTSQTCTISSLRRSVMRVGRLLDECCTTLCCGDVC